MYIFYIKFFVDIVIVYDCIDEVIIFFGIIWEVSWYFVFCIGYDIIVNVFNSIGLLLIKLILGLMVNLRLIE